MGVANPVLSQMVRSLSTIKQHDPIDHDMDMLQALLARGMSPQALTTAMLLCTQPKMMQAFLDAGADVNAQDQQGNTALHHAARRNDLAMVQLLLEYNANGAIPNHQGKRADQLSTHPDIIWLITEAVRLTGGEP